MQPNIKNIIISALKIDRMSHSELKASIFDLLEKNPTLVSKHFIGIEVEKNGNVGKIPAGDPTPTNQRDLSKLSYIVLENVPRVSDSLIVDGSPKIQCIKFIREVFGLGIAESKAFVEGASFVTPMHPKGVLYTGKYYECDVKLREFIAIGNKYLRDTSKHLAILDEDQYKTFRFDHY